MVPCKAHLDGVRITASYRGNVRPARIYRPRTGEIEAYVGGDFGDNHVYIGGDGLELDNPRRTFDMNTCIP